MMKHTILLIFALLLMAQNGYCETTKIETVNSSGEKAFSTRYGNNHKVVTLENGNKVKILSIGPFHFKNGDPSALVLTYETEMELSNYSKLKSEVDEIWERFRHDVEKSGFTVAAIRAQKSLKEEKGKRMGQGHGFVFSKQEKGSWKQEE